MDLSIIAPYIQEAIQTSLQERVYPFGFVKYQGLSNKIAKGTLYNSVEARVTERKDNTVISIFMEDYFVWVQSGRLPGKKGVPIDAIEEWIKNRGLLGRDKKGRFIKRRSFAFAIQKNIKKFGIRPSNFLDRSLDKIENDQRIIDELGEQGYEELINKLEGI